MFSILVKKSFADTYKSYISSVFQSTFIFNQVKSFGILKFINPSFESLLAI